MTRRASWSLLAVLVMLLAACGDESSDPELPGAGTSIRLARADWTTGHFQAEIYADLLRRLGYTVNEPADLELSRTEFYERAAAGNVDAWANGWFPGDEELLLAAESVGLQVEQGALQGIVIDSASVEDHGIASLGDIAADPDLVALFDTDGDGRAEVLGCNEGWACADRLDELLAAAGPQALVQVKGNYDAHVKEALQRIEAGRPVLLYVWTPSATLGLLGPGDNVQWLDVRPGGDGTEVALERGTCTQPDCRMGWVPSDITVVASTGFLDANPAARRLFEVVEVPLDDIVRQNIQMERGFDSARDLKAQVDQWLGERRGQVLDWLTAARRAADD